MVDLIQRTKEFMHTNPNENQVESFYVNEILPYTKDSIEDLLTK